MIDNDLNKKKKQPKFVIEGKYKLDEVKWQEKLPADWMFMETCRYIKGAFIYDVRCFSGIFDLPTYPHQILYYISLFSKIR